jgi:CRISPR-associated exonuclease Cas4
MCDDVQLAAQALCLEEMTGKAVSTGALFYARSKRRRVVPISPALRARVEETTRSVRAMLESGRLPPPTHDRARCRECSLKDICQPDAVAALAQSEDLRSDLFEPDV